MKYLPNVPGAGNNRPPMPQGDNAMQVMDSSQVRALMALQQQQMQLQLQEQLMAQEMYAYQQQLAMQQQYEQQMAQLYQQQQRQMQQQYHATHLDANDVRSMMGKLAPGESFQVEMYQGFEVRHTKQRLNGAQIVVALIIAAAILVMAVLS